MRSAANMTAATLQPDSFAGTAIEPGTSAQSMLTLFVALAGLSILVGAVRRRPLWLLSALFGAMGHRTGRLWIAAMGLLLVLFLQVQFPGMGRLGKTVARHILMGGPSPWPALSALTGTDDDAPPIPADVLSQKDPANYRDPSFPAVIETLDDGRSTTVGNLTCLATLYTMLERQRGARDACIDDYYEDPRIAGGRSRGAINPPSYVQPEEPFNRDVAMTELQSARPVILKAVGGTMGSHYILAVSFEGGAGIPHVTVLDPLPASGTQRPGRTQQLDADGSTWLYPSRTPMPITSMRRVAYRWSNEAR